MKRKTKTKKSHRFVWTAILVVAGLLFTYLPNQRFNFTTAQLATVMIETEDGYGSGVVVKRVNSSGEVRLFVWTVNHVMGRFHEAEVKLHVRAHGSKVGTSTFHAREIYYDKDDDLALLWLDAPPTFFPSVEFGDLSPLAVGDRVYAVGNAYGSVYDGTVTDGIISQVGISFMPDHGLEWRVADQITAGISPGMSGGPVFSAQSGRIVGLAVGTNGNGINVFIPVRAIEEFVFRHAIDWALYDGECPSDDKLSSEADVDELLKWTPSKP